MLIIVNHSELKVLKGELEDEYECDVCGRCFEAFLVYSNMYESYCIRVATTHETIGNIQLCNSLREWIKEHDVTLINPYYNGNVLFVDLLPNERVPKQR